MTPEERRQILSTVRWNCPHCNGDELRFGAAVEHIRSQHFECFGCSIESVMLSGVIRGVGTMWFQTPAQHLIDS